MARPATIDARALTAALTRRGRAAVTTTVVDVLAVQLAEIVTHYQQAARYNRRAHRDPAAAYAATVTQQLDALAQTIERRHRALVGTAPRRATLVTSDTVFALHTRTWLRQLRRWHATASQAQQTTRKAAHRPVETTWLTAAANVWLALTDAGVPITTSETGVFVRVLRIVADACGRTVDVRATARTIVAAQREQGEK